MNILFVGDVFGSAGRHIVREHLPHVLETNDVDLLIINGENAAGGFGLTPSIAEELFDLGAHVITTGNHIWDKKEIFEYMTVPAESHARGRRVLRPANYAVGTPGYGLYQGELPTGQCYAVMNLQCRVFMSSCDDPFRKADELLGQRHHEVRFLRRRVAGHHDLDGVEPARRDVPERLPQGLPEERRDGGDVDSKVHTS